MRLQHVAQDQEPPFTSVSVKFAAKELGVGRELVEGLVSGGQIRAFLSPGRTGHPVMRVDAKQVRELRDRVRPAESH